MIAAVLLMVYAFLMGTVVARRLFAAQWPARSPRLGIWAWQALTASVLLAVVLAGAAMAVPRFSWDPALGGLIDACWLAVRQRYGTPGGAVATSVGLGLAIVVSARLVVVLTAECLSLTRRRSEQRRRLLLVADRYSSGLLVLPHPTSVIYCLPGRRGVVVCTSGAVRSLQPKQLAAVIAHEDAHLRERHDRVLLWAAAFQAAFPFVPACRLGQKAVGHLIEMRADDLASRRFSRDILATALVTLAGATVPTTGLGAGDTAALIRVRRLLKPAEPISRRHAVILGLGTVTLGMVPLILAVGPAVAAVLAAYCPLPFLAR